PRSSNGACRRSRCFRHSPAYAAACLSSLQGNASFIRHMSIPIKNGYQLESLCPNVILAFFPCGSHMHHASVCSKGRCMNPTAPRYGFLRDLESSESFLICSHFL